MMSSSSSSSSSDDGECSSSTEQPPLPVEDEIIVSAAEAEVEAEEAEDPSSSPPSSSPPSSSESSSGSSSSSSGSSSNSSPTTTASATKSLPTAASAGAADDHTTATVTTAVSTNTNSNSSSPPTTSSSTSTSPTNSNESSNASNATTPPATTDTRRRVKLYMLNANRTWDDRGTGHVSSSYVDRLNGVSLLVKAETDGSLLLESRILADTAYQKQQDTLIVWSEGENYDLALSFQERVGCEEIWAKICQVQGKDPSVDITQDIMEDDDNELPPCEADRLDEISTIISSSLTMQAKKDSITLALETENYIPKLLTLFRALEERKDISALSKMYDIFKSIFLLNRNSLFDIMLSEEALWDVIGVFEYDPTGARVREAAEEAKKRAVASMAAREAKEAAAAAGSSETEGGPSTPPGPGESGSQHQLRAVNTNSAKPETYFNSLPASTESELSRLIREKRHREFLKNVSRFKEVIPLSKSELVAKIHQTYRVQYIQDVILPTPSVFEDNMLSTLSSFIFFNKVEIVSLIQQDDKFLKELFRQLADGSREFREKRRDLVLFLKELCTFSHTLQLQNREVFIKTLANLGLLHTLELLLSADDVPVKLGAVDILTYIVDYSPSMVREYALQQDQNEKEGIRFSAIPPHLQLSSEKFLLNIIIIQMICDVDPDLGMATQLSNILKLLIDPENMLTTSPINKSEKSEFLNHFYRHSINYLTKPILSATHIDTTSATASPEVIAAQQRAIEFSLSYEQSCQSAQLFAIILELLTFCIEHHAYHIRSYLLSKEIVRSIMVLTKSKHTFLVLAVIRFVRRLVGLKDEFYNRHITNVNLFAPIIDALLANKGRYNLLDSAIIDLFEFINSNSILSLINYTMEHFWKGKLERIDYVRTFRLMRNFYETQSQMRERLDSQSFLLARHRFRRDPRQLDKEEDMWFNNEEDDDEEECAEDDEDEDCENYHDDDGEGGLPDSPPSSQRHLQQAVAAAAAAAANTTTAASETIGFYTNAAAAAAAAAAALVSGTAGSTSPSAHKSQSSAVNSAGDGGSGSPLHSLSHHNLAHQQQQSSVSSTTSSTGGAYDGGAGQGQGHGHSSSSSPSSSAYDSPTSAFIDSPFFSSFSASKRRKFSEKKTLTINLNTKGSGYLNTTTTSSSSASTTTNNGGSNSSTSSSQVLSTVGFISSNHSSPVTSTPAASTASTTTSTTPSLFAKSFAQVNSLLIGAAAAAGAQAAAMANLAVSATAGGADGGAVVGYQQKELLSRKRALVDYPDEDSDEDDADDDEAEGEDHEEEEEEEDLMDVDEDS